MVTLVRCISLSLWAIFTVVNVLKDLKLLYGVPLYYF